MIANAVKGRACVSVQCSHGVHCRINDAQIVARCEMGPWAVYYCRESPQAPMCLDRVLEVQVPPGYIEITRGMEVRADSPPGDWIGLAACSGRGRLLPK